MKEIGFIGTGLLGYPMAEKLLGKYDSINIYNRTSSKAEPLLNKGGKIFGNPEDVISKSEIIILMLSEINAINSIFKKCSPDDLQDKTIIQMGTIATKESLELEKYFSDNNANYLEAPVLGSIPQAKAAELIIMAGGDKDIFNQNFELLKIFGKEIYYVGPVGKAASLKLALNHLIAAETTAFSLSLKFVVENDIDVEMFMGILRNSALYAPTFDKKLNKMLNDDFTNPNFPVKHLLKDIDLIINDFKTKDVDVVPVEAIKEILKRAIAKGDGELDYSALFNSVKK